METNNISKLVKNLGGVISRNSSTILTGLAVGGIITTTILAVKATPKALELLEEAKRNREEQIDNNEEIIDNELTKLDIIKLTWKCYIPSIGFGVATIICLIEANQINLRRNAALVSVYSVAETALKEYQAKVTETIGKNKEKDIRTAIASDQIKAHPASSSQIICTGVGESMCYDRYTGRYFKSNIDAIKRAENELNYEIKLDRFVTLNDLYYKLNLPPTQLGDEKGWCMDDGYIYFEYDSHLTDEGVPCLSVGFTVKPKSICR